MEMTANASLASPAGSLYTYPELVFCAVGFSILSGVAIAGNTLVLVAVARNEKLQNVTNVFVVNLSVSDCLSSFAMLWSVPGMASTTPGYPLQSEVPCIITAALVFSTVGSSLHTLANIALNRCILITRPKETFRWLYTPRKITLMVLGSWLVPLCAIVVPPLCGIGDIGFDPESQTCTDIDTHPRAAAYDKIQVTTFYPLPLVVIVVSYVIIWRHVKRHFKKRRQADIGLQSSTIVPLSSACNLDNDDDGKVASTPAGSLRNTNSIRQLGRMRSDQLAITKNLFVVVFAFFVCFTPLAVMVLTKNNRYQLYAGMLLFVSGCINPFIYATKHPHFRPVLRSMLRCRCAKE